MARTLCDQTLPGGESVTHLVFHSQEILMAFPSQNVGGELMTLMPRLGPSDITTAVRKFGAEIERLSFFDLVDPLPDRSRFRLPHATDILDGDAVFFTVTDLRLGYVA